MTRVTVILALGVAWFVTGCAGGEGDAAQEDTSSAPSLSQAEKAVWSHVSVRVDRAAGKPRVVSGCNTEGEFVLCVVDYQYSCGVFAVTSVGGRLKVEAPSGRRACLHVSDVVTRTRPYVVDP